MVTALPPREPSERGVNRERPKVLVAANVCLLVMRWSALSPS